MSESVEKVMENPLAKGNVGKLLAEFGIPAVISMMMSAVYNIVDQIFIGWGVGYLGNEATTVAFPAVTISCGVALLLGIGTASNYNLKCGQGHSEEARRIAANGLVYIVLFGLAIMAIVLAFLKPLMLLFGATDTVLPYAIEYMGVTAVGMPFFMLCTGGTHLVRADQRPKIAMATMIVGNVINLILDPVFIFICDWGVGGAAWATVIGQMASGVMVLVYFARFSVMRFTPQMLVPKLKYLSMILKLGVSSFIAQAAIAVVQITMNNAIAKYGAMSVYGADVAVACSGVILKVSQIMFSICIGMSQGSQPIVGFNYGARLYPRVKKTYLLAARVCVIAGIGFFIVSEFFPDQVLILFGTSDELYLEYGRRFFRIFNMMLPIVSIQPMTGGFFAAIGKPIIAAIVALTRQILFYVPLLIVLPLFMGLDGVLFSAPIADTATFIVTVLFVRREFKKISIKEQR